MERINFNNPTTIIHADEWGTGWETSTALGFSVEDGALFFYVVLEDGRQTTIWADGTEIIGNRAQEIFDGPVPPVGWQWR